MPATITLEKTDFRSTALLLAQHRAAALLLVQQTVQYPGRHDATDI